MYIHRMNTIIKFFDMTYARIKEIGSEFNCAIRKVAWICVLVWFARDIGAAAKRKRTRANAVLIEKDDGYREICIQITVQRMFWLSVRSLINIVILLFFFSHTWLGACFAFQLNILYFVYENVLDGVFMFIWRMMSVFLSSVLDFLKKNLKRRKINKN